MEYYIYKSYLTDDDGDPGCIEYAWVTDSQGGAEGPYKTFDKAKSELLKELREELAEATSRYQKMIDRLEKSSSFEEYEENEE
jgi:hypothetical protein